MMIFKFKIKFCIAIHAILEDKVLRRLLMIRNGVDEKTTRYARGRIEGKRAKVYRVRLVPC
jgi:hypothetical protein